LKIYTKKKWLQRSPSFLSAIILKEVEDDEDSGSDKSGSDEEDSKSGSDSKSEGSDDEESSSVPKFNPKMSSTNFTFSNKNRKVVFNGTSWNGTVLGTKCSKYTIKVGTLLYGYLMMGFAPKNINLSGSNYTSCGYYLYITNGTLYSQGGQSGSTYQGGFAYSSGSLVGAQWDKKKRNYYFLCCWSTKRCCL